jgi:hypothetical protein
VQWYRKLLMEYSDIVAAMFVRTMHKIKKKGSKHLLYGWDMD